MNETEESCARANLVRGWPGMNHCCGPGIRRQTFRRGGIWGGGRAAESHRIATKNRVRVARLGLLILLVLSACTSPEAPSNGEIQRLRDLSGSQTASSQREVISRIAEILSQGRDGDVLGIELRCLLGESHFRIRQLEEAESAFREGLHQIGYRVFRPLPEISELRSRLLNGLAATLNLKGENRKGLQVARAALGTARRLTSPGQAIRALNNISDSHYNLGDGDLSIRFARQALELAESRKDLPGAALSWLNLGYNYADRNQKELALQAYSHAEELFAGQKDRSGSARTAIALAGLFSAMGEKQRALGQFQAALETLEELGDNLWKGSVLSGIGYIYAGLGLLDQARDYYRQSVAAYELATFPKGLAGVVRLIGVSHLEEQRPDLAMPYLERAVQLGTSMQDTRVLARAFLDQGRALLQSNRLDEARSHFERSQELNERHRDDFGISNSLRWLGAITEARGDLAAASGFYQRALQHSCAAKHPYAIVQAASVLAAAQQRLGRPDEALENARLAVALIEELRSALAPADSRISYFALVRASYERLASLLLEAAKPPVEAARLAFSVSEMARARSLIDTLDQAGISWFAGAEADPATPPGDLCEVPPERQPVDPLLAGRLQEQLEPDQMVVEFLLGEEESYRWRVDRRSIALARLPPAREIELLVREFQAEIRSLESRQESRVLAIGKNLAELLLPAESEGKHLIISADGALHTLPFAALPERNSDELGNRLVSYLPSATLGLKLEPNLSFRNRPVTVIADPVFGPQDSRYRRQAGQDPVPAKEAGEIVTRAVREAGLAESWETLPRLRETAAEAATIAQKAVSAQVYLGFEARKSVVLNWEGEGIIHIASHAIANNDQPELSGIVFAPDQPANGERRPGFLALEEIYALQGLPFSSSLIVLSACETAFGKQAAGEGLISLAHGFLGKGASGVVAALWRVDDRATARFMATFYEELFAGSGRPARALQRARSDLRESGRWNSPQHWAAFRLLGAW